MMKSICFFIVFSFFSFVYGATIGFIDTAAINSTAWASQVLALGGTINSSLNFEAHSLGTTGIATLSTTCPNVFATGVGPSQGNVTASLPGEGLHVSSRYIHLTNSGTFTIAFSTDVGAVGFQTIDLFTDTTAKIEAFNSSGVSLGSFTRAAGTNFQNSNVYYMGILSTTGNIRSVVFTFTQGGGDTIGLDNIQYATGIGTVPVPEPSVLFLMVIGIFGFVARFQLKRP